MRKSGRQRVIHRLARSLAAAVILVAAACSGPPAAEAPPAPPPNLVLISIDTLRADHLGCYGYPRDTSPHLDSLARDGIRFSAAFAPTPWTFPSHASMLTGTNPYEIGIRNSMRTIPREIPIVAELLAQQGYQTAAFVDSEPTGFVGAQRGFGRGFESYEHAPHRAGLAERFDMAATVDAALEWLDERDPSRPFFLFLHTKSVHAVPNDADCLDARCFPYDKPEPYRFRFVPSEQARFSWTSPEDGAGQRYLWSQNAKILRGELDPTSYPAERLEVLKALYDAGIYYVDDHLGRLFADLRRRGLFEQSVIIVTSDHGEAFLDHFLFMHQEVYDALLRVPLIVRLPTSLSRDRGRATDRQVLLADIAPTILQLAGVGVPASMTGYPLPLAGEADLRRPEGREIFAYYVFPRKFTYQAFAVRQGKWKLVVHNVEAPDRFRRELYNTELDPDERRPLSGEDEVREKLRQMLRRWLRHPPVAQGDELLHEDLPNLEAIRSLGYIE